jgi:ubiquinol-cytochrome c reductase cytochrome c subunit
VRTLSIHRRHPLAGVVVLLLGLVVVGGIYSMLAPRSAARADDTSSDLVAEGRRLFLVGCASCHGLNADGIEQDDGGQYGPSLVGVGAAAVDFQVSTGRMPLAQNAQQAPDKEAVYSEEETEALAAFVASLAPGPMVPPEEAYDTEGLSRDEIVEGREFYQTNCSACHGTQGQGGALGGGRYAPTLWGVEGRHIYEAMITGPQSMPVFSDALITPDEKRKVIGYVTSLDDQTNYGGSGLGAFGPVTEGLAAWVVGMGALVGAATWIGASTVRARKQ